MPARLRSARGQASIEWIVGVLVVATALGGARAVGVPVTEAVPRAVSASFTRAYCLVSGGDCLSGAPRPCVVASDERSRERRATIAVLRLADGRTVLREDRSDGTVAVSVEDGVRVGAGVMWGGELSVNGRGGKLAASVQGDGRGSRGRRFVLPDAAAARALLARLGEEHRGTAGVVTGGSSDLVPDERWWVAGRGSSAQAEAELNVVRTGGRAALSRTVVAGIRSRPATGERTFLLRADGELVAALTGPLGARLGMTLAGRTVVELALDAHGRPVSFLVRTSRRVHGEAAFGPFRSGGGDLVEAEVRLDLADPVLRDEVAALVDAIGDVAPRRAAAAARTVGWRLAERARVDLRLYETDQTSSVRGMTGGILARFGYEVEETTRTARLVDAAGREPGLGWARRLDCVGVGAGVA